MPLAGKPKQGSSLNQMPFLQNWHPEVICRIPCRAASQEQLHHCHLSVRAPNTSLQRSFCGGRGSLNFSTFATGSNLWSGRRAELGHAPPAPCQPWPTWHLGNPLALASRARLCIHTQSSQRTQPEIRRPRGCGPFRQLSASSPSASSLYLAIRGLCAKFYTVGVPERGALASPGSA